MERIQVPANILPTKQPNSPPIKSPIMLNILTSINGKPWDYFYSLVCCTLIGLFANILKFVTTATLNWLLFSLFMIDIFKPWLIPHQWKRLLSTAQFLIASIVCKSFSEDYPTSFFSTCILKFMAYIIGAHIFSSTDKDDDSVLISITTGCIMSISWNRNISFLIFVPFCRNIVNINYAAMIHWFNGNRTENPAYSMQIDLKLFRVLGFVGLGFICGLIPYEALGDIDVFFINVYLGFLSYKLSKDFQSQQSEGMREFLNDPVTAILNQIKNEEEKNARTNSAVNPTQVTTEDVPTQPVDSPAQVDAPAPPVNVNPTQVIQVITEDDMKKEAIYLLASVFAILALLFSR